MRRAPLLAKMDVSIWGVAILGWLALASSAVVYLGWLVAPGWMSKGLYAAIVTKPATAFVSLCLSAAFLLLLPSAAPAWKRRLAQALSLVAMLVGILVFLRYLLGWNPESIQWFFHRDPALRALDVSGWMAPLSAFCVELLALALLLMDWNWRRLCRPTEALAFLSFSISLFCLLGFFFEPHSIRGANFQLRMSLITSCLICTLAMGVLLARPRRGLVGLFAGKRAHGQRWMLLLPVALSYGLVLTVGSYAYNAQMRRYFTSVFENLQSIERAKIFEVQSWREGRTSDAQALSVSRDFLRMASSWIHGQGGRLPLSARLRERLEPICLSDEYADAMLADPQGRIVYSLTESQAAPGEQLLQTLALARRLRKAVLSEFYRESRSGAIRMEAVAPLYLAPADAEPFGYLLLRIDAEEALVHMVRRWPGEQRTGETYVARREGASVLFLHALQGSQAPSLTLRIPLARTEAPSVQAILGFRGALIGRDYANELIIAAVDSVPKSGWVLISKIDASEAIRQWKVRTWPTLALTALTMATVFLIVAILLLQYSRYRRLKALGRREREQEARFRALFSQSPDPILLMEGGCFVDCNQAAYEILRWRQPERIVNITPAALSPEFQPDGESSALKSQRMNAIAAREGVHRFEWVHRRMDGSLFDAQVTLSRILLGEKEIFYSLWRDITEARRNRAALEVSEERYRSLVTATAQIVWNTDAAGQVTEDMPTWRAFTGQSREALRGGGWLEALHSDDREQAIQGWAQAVQRRELYRAEYRLRRHDGRYRDMEAHGAPVLEADGGIREWVGTCADITERKRVEVALQESEGRLRLATRAAAIGVWVWDLAQDAHIWDARLHELYESPPELREGERVEAFWRTRCHPEDRARVEQERLDSLQLTTPSERQYRILPPQGGLRHIHEASIVVRDESGRALRMVGVNQDITERIQAEQRLLDAERRFRSLFDHSPEACFVLDADWTRILECNRAAEQLLGGDREQILHYSLQDLLSASFSHGRTSQNGFGAIAGDSGARFEWMSARLNGEIFWCDISTASIMLADRRATLAVWRDISQRKALEARLEDLVQKLNQSLKAARQTNEQLGKANADLEQFAFVASHDLQEPLRKVQAFGEMLQDALVESGVQNPRLSDYVVRMQTAAQRMRALIDNLLAFSRVGGKEKVMPQTELRAAVQAAIDEYGEKYASVGGEVHLCELPSIEADPMQITQIFCNLLGNSWKFRRTDEPLRVEISCEAIEEGIRIIYRDNGVGFEQQYAERIFGIFQRLHSRQEYEGAGIGLSICRKIAERHHGRISARGEPGRGAEFVLELPQRQPGGPDRA